jgi:hypothetical protein
MNRLTITTAEAAFLLGIPAGSFARWARDHGVEPLRGQRIGRSTITVWSIAQLRTASAPTTSETSRRAELTEITPAR